MDTFYFTNKMVDNKFKSNLMKYSLKFYHRLFVVVTHTKIEKTICRSGNFPTLY